MIKQDRKCKRKGIIIGMKLYVDTLFTTDINIEI